MTDNRTTELREKLTERGVEWTKPKSAAEFIKTTFLRNGWGIEVLERNIGLCVTATNVFDTPEQAIAATLGSDDRYDAGFASGVQAVFQQLEGIEDYEGLQDLIAEYWGEGEGYDEP